MVSGNVLGFLVYFLDKILDILFSILSAVNLSASGKSF
jgi:hypothetical protein